MVPYPTFERSRYSRKMNEDTVSVAPPGPPDVTLMTMSASLSWKMMRNTTAVTLTGSMSGKVICQKLCHLLAPSTLAASDNSFGRACRPANSMIMMKGIHTQASMIAMEILAIQGVVKNAGLSQPRYRARLATGPYWYSANDLPIIQL